MAGLGSGSLSALAWLVPTTLSLIALAVSRRGETTASVYQTVVGTYSNPQGSMHLGHLDIVRNDKRIRLDKLREIRLWARDEQLRNCENWLQKSTSFNEPFSDESKAAYLISHSLGDLGSAAITGGIPVKIIFAIAGNVVLDDWIVCRDWIAAYRDITQNTASNDESVAYGRRHGEWLAMLCALIFSRDWSYQRMDEVVLNINPYERFLAITRVDRRLIPVHVRWELFNFLPWRYKLRMIWLGRKKSGFQ